MPYRVSSFTTSVTLLDIGGELMGVRYRTGKFPLWSMLPGLMSRLDYILHILDFERYLPPRECPLRVLEMSVRPPSANEGS